MTTEIPEPVIRLAAAHEDVVSLADARTYLSYSSIRRQLRARRWQRPTRAALVLHNSELTPGQLARVALLSAPSGSALSGPTAARIDGMERLPTLPVHLTVPRGNRRPDVEAKIHWSSRLDDEDVHPTREPRRTRIARSVVDWASWQTYDRAAREIVLSAVQQRLVTPAQLRDALSRRGPCRHHLLILESIGDAEGGIHSMPERELVDVVRGASIPPPDHQLVRVRPDGRFFIDAGWRRYQLYAEVEGAQHLWVEQREADLERLNDLTAAGDDVLLFTSFAVRRRPHYVASTLVRALMNRGWRGP